MVTNQLRSVDNPPSLPYYLAGLLFVGPIIWRRFAKYKNHRSSDVTMRGHYTFHAHKWDM